MNSVRRHTLKNVVIHDFNFEKIKSKKWFDFIKDLPSLHKDGRRDGYYNAWKAFCVQETYEIINDDDFLYYVDCSQHYRSGFTQSIDKLCEIVQDKGFVAGSVADDGINNVLGACSDIKVWDKIIPNNDNSKYLGDKHVLNAWFMLKKTASNTKFVNEWAHWTGYKDDDLRDPLVTYHHTGDQSIFNILVRKYNLCVFYKKEIKHDENKNKNKVLEIINNNPDYLKYFIIL